MLGETKCNNVYEFWNVLGGRASAVALGCLTAPVKIVGAELSFPVMSDSGHSINNWDLSMYMLYQN